MKFASKTFRDALQPPGILAEVLKPIMGKGLIPADPITWLARRRAITPAFHQKWLHDQMSLCVPLAEECMPLL